MNKRVIVSDVGGTNGRFAIAEFSRECGRPEINSIQVLPCKNYPYFSDMFSAYIESINGEIPKTAQLSIAGEMSRRKGYLRHQNWHICATELEEKFHLDNVVIMNDYEALAFAVLHLPKDDLIPLTNANKGLAGMPISTFGAGTGFGASIAVPIGETWKIISTETGHMSFSPKTKLEHDLSMYLAETINHVAIETLLSGPGLERIHAFLVAYEGSGNPDIYAHEITAAAKSREIPSCVRAVQLFLSILGSVAGDIAYSHGSRGGIYMGGGIIPKMANLVPQSDFLERFTNKGPMSSYLKDIPIYIVKSELSALLGASMANFD